MILRRVISHVRNQEWTAIGIDFLIVVLGVFVGIQVSNWNEARVDERLGQDYTERLLVDLRKDHESRQRLVAYFDAVSTSAEQTLALFSDPNADPLALVVNAYRATEQTFNPQTRATWDEIVSSGNAGLLPRAAVESGIADYFAYDFALASHEGLRNSPYRIRVRSVMPHALQSAIRSGCGDEKIETGEVVGFQDECVLNVEDALITQAATALRGDTEVIEGLRYHFSGLASARANVRGDVVFLERAIAALEGKDFEADSDGGP